MNSSDLTLYNGISDLLPDGIILYNLFSKNVVYINAAGSAFTGIQTHDDQKKIMKFWQQVAIQDRAYLSAQFYALLHEPESRSAEFEITREGQHKMFLQATACADQDKTILVIFLRDITQVKQHEDFLVEFGIKKNTLLDTLTHNLSGSLRYDKAFGKACTSFYRCVYA